MKLPTGIVGSWLGHRQIGWLLAGLLLLTGATRAAPMAGASHVVGRVGGITVSATILRPGPSDAFTSDLRITTSAPASDQLDAAVAAGDTAVGVFHQQVSVGEIPDLASCDGSLPSPQVVGQWLHYGPLIVPGRAYSLSPPARATLIITAAGVSLHRSLAITLYFTHAGRLTLELPIRPT